MKSKTGGCLNVKNPDTPFTANEKTHQINTLEKRSRICMGHVKQTLLLIEIDLTEGWAYQMLIQVIYPNGKHDLVKDFYLSYLIQSEKIEKFRRAEGWINISAPNVRSNYDQNDYHGPERRLLETSNNNQDNSQSAPIEFYSS